MNNILSFVYVLGMVNGVSATRNGHQFYPETHVSQTSRWISLRRAEEGVEGLADEAGT
jgi:hypothetical protein